MGNENGYDGSSLGSGVDYKTLFVGACTLIVLLAGAAFRIWDTGNHRDEESIARRLDRIEARLDEMEAGHIGYRFEIEHLKRSLERK